MTECKYFVTMTDKYLSGWGISAGKINKLVFECASFDEALTVFDNANARDDMKFINIRSGKMPYYRPGKYFVQIKTKEEYPTWYKKRRF